MSLTWLTIWFLKIDFSYIFCQNTHTHIPTHTHTIGAGYSSIEPAPNMAPAQLTHSSIACFVRIQHYLMFIFLLTIHPHTVFKSVGIVWHDDGRDRNGNTPQSETSFLLWNVYKYVSQAIKSSAPSFMVFWHLLFI